VNRTNNEASDYAVLFSLFI